MKGNTISNKPVILTIRGKASFMKLLGDPVPNFGKDGLEWKTDVQISPAVVKELKAAGIGKKIKQKDEYLDGQPYISFKQPEFKRSGDRNDPIPVVDILNDPWDQSTLIGNGSDVEIRFAVVDTGAPNKGTYLRKVRILNLIPYARKDFEEIDETDEFAAQAEAARRRRELAADGIEEPDTELEDSDEDDTL